jgi:hypothetical protein
MSTDEHGPLLSRVCTLLYLYPACWESVVRLWKNGFGEVGQGCLKLAMSHRDFPGWVVKLFKRQNLWKEDCSTRGLIVQELIPFWLPNAVVSERFVIQPRADGVGGTPDEALAAIRAQLAPFKNSCPFDTHPKNTAFHQGRPVLLDYALNWRQLPSPSGVSLNMTIL